MKKTIDKKVKASAKTEQEIEIEKLNLEKMDNIGMDEIEKINAVEDIEPPEQTLDEALEEISRAPQPIDTRALKYMKREDIMKIDLQKLQLHEKLRAMRRIIGITQQQVASCLNIDRSTYTYYETGKTSPDIKTILKLIKIFNVDYDQLLGEMPPPNKTPRKGTSEYDFSFGRINELTKQEKLMIISYRLLSDNLRKDYLTEIINKARNQYGEEF